MSIHDGELDQDVLDLLRDIGEHLDRGGNLEMVRRSAERDQAMDPRDQVPRYLEPGWKLGVDLRIFLASHRAARERKALAQRKDVDLRDVL